MSEGLRKIVRQMKDAKGQAKKAEAFLSLNGFEPKKRDLPDVYWALRQDYPDDRGDGATRCRLLRMLDEVHDATTPAVIRDLYSRLPPSKAIRAAALEMLATINTRPALSVLSEILWQERLKPCLENTSLFWPILACPKNAWVMFPKLLDLLPNEVLREGVYAIAAAGLNEGVLKPDALCGALGRILQDYGEALRVLARRNPTWSTYGEAVDYVAAIVTVMKVFPGNAELRNAILGAVQHDNAEIALTAFRACMEHSWETAPGAVERFAADPSTRLSLFEYLREAGLEAVFPRKWLSQEFFAEADMVRWLMHPNEYGRPPQKIKLVEARTGRLRGEKGRLYIYEFTYPQNPRQWLVGISGPQPVDPREMVTTGSATFSESRPLRECGVEEHLELLEWTDGKAIADS